jgi:hypothetical protein
MAGLSDGTSHVQQTVLNTIAKQFVVTTTSSNYQKLGGEEGWTIGNKSPEAVIAASADA